MSKVYGLYLLDLDGTMYRGTERIEAAVRFVQKLHREQISYAFVTNNSTKTREDVVNHLQSFDIPASFEQVFTTSIATVAVLKKKIPAGAHVYWIGEEGLTVPLQEAGFTFSEENPAAVVMGLNRKCTYEQLATAAYWVQQGVPFISTNADTQLPTERGFQPGNGSLTKVVELATNKQPLFIGKPERHVIDLALTAYNVKEQDAVLIGDNVHTDLLAGERAGVDTAFVLTGVSTREDAIQEGLSPTYVLDSLDEWRWL
ncbi:TIGR01457 family HAD-type hydrolase [Bacillus fonticola]|uniref:TIGR01457 family HAD-type hydrolase n=1 Tax=Bacillus fonticola TaxID=2728853 RepID=UPI0014760AF0|nr:TIGR01457 family HAD-type hydrolase [Bacillus fonticola]